MNKSYPRLRTIESPQDLRCLPESELLALAEELRAFLLDSVSQSGGHFAAAEEPDLLVEDPRAFFRPLRP